MSKIMQNLVLLMDLSEEKWKIPYKAGNMCLNRFCIDEDACFELSGINYFQKAQGLSYLEDKGKE